MKKCFRCETVKRAGEFYKHAKMADGRLNKCKDCTKADVRKNVEKNPEKRAEYERERYQRPERKAASAESARKFHKRNPGKAVEYQRTARARAPEKNKARAAVSRAMRSGKLVREPCESCGAAKSEGHHEDYTKPLDVRWLCRKCHCAHHRAHG